MKRVIKQTKGLIKGMLLSPAIHAASSSKTAMFVNPLIDSGHIEFRGSSDSKMNKDGVVFMGKFLWCRCKATCSFFLTISFKSTFRRPGGAVKSCPFL